MFGSSYPEDDNFFDSFCDVISQLGVSLLYLCLAFMVVTIGLFFIAKFRKANKELKQLKYAPAKTLSDETAKN